MVCRVMRNWLGAGDSSIGMMQFAVYAVLSVCCTQCMLYSVYAVLSVCCTPSLLVSATVPTR